MPNLEPLYLTANSFGDLGVIAFAEACAKHHALPQLKTLDLVSINWTVDGVRSLARAFLSRALPKLEELLVNFYYADGPRFLRDAVHHPQLSSVCMARGIEVPE